MPAPQHQLPLPEHLQHRPVFAVPYFDHDPDRERDTDCQYLSIGWSQWDDKEVSAKTFRHGDRKWSRQSEEVPLARLIDVASLVVLAVEARDGEVITIPAGFYENQPNELTVRRQGGSDNEREFFRQSIVDNEKLHRRLERLTDLLIERRQARLAGHQ